MAKATKNGAEPVTIGEPGTKEKICRTVKIRGVTDIAFDRYPGDNDTKLEVWQKMYFVPGSKTLCLPATNVMSALSAQNTDSWPKRLLDSRKYKAFCFAAASYVLINPSHIPFSRDGQPIVFGKFGGNEVDELSGVYIRRDTARLPKGIPNPKIRPFLPMPWGLEFKLELWPNRYLQEQQLMNVFTEGLFAFGFGTWRGQFGKGVIECWE